MTAANTPLNTCQAQAATMTPSELDCARRLYENACPDGDLLELITANSAEAAYWLRCGVLGTEPTDGE